MSDIDQLTGPDLRDAVLTKCLGWRSGSVECPPIADGETIVAEGAEFGSVLVDSRSGQRRRISPTSDECVKLQQELAAATASSEHWRAKYGEAEQQLVELQQRVAELEERVDRYGAFLPDDYCE